MLKVDTSHAHEASKCEKRYEIRAKDIYMYINHAREALKCENRYEMFAKNRYQPCARSLENAKIVMESC